jgi:hypothetical protein
MTLFVLITQLLLPLLLLAWLAFSPARGVAAFALQATAVALVLLGLGLAALWTLPPFWVPWCYGVMFFAIVVGQLVGGRVDTTAIWSAGRLQTVAILLALAPASYGAWLSVTALQGRALPDRQAFDIAPPFGPGTYLIAHGGSTETVNVHLKTLNPEVPRFRNWRGQSLALDIFYITPMGRHVTGWLPEDPARYKTFDIPLLAPCAGTIARAEDGLPDMPVPKMDTDNKAGNFIAIDCGDAHVILGHLKQGSVAVSQGDTVASGDYLGRAGNSGNSSEPHLHIHAQRGLGEGEYPMAAEPLALTINGRFLVRNDRLRVPAQKND